MDRRYSLHRVAYVGARAMALTERSLINAVAVTAARVRLRMTLKGRVWMAAQDGERWATGETA